MTFGSDTDYIIYSHALLFLLSLTYKSKCLYGGCFTRLLNISAT